MHAIVSGGGQVRVTFFIISCRGEQQTRAHFDNLALATSAEGTWRERPAFSTVVAKDEPAGPMKRHEEASTLQLGATCMARPDEAALGTVAVNRSRDVAWR